MTDLSNRDSRADELLAKASIRIQRIIVVLFALGILPASFMGTKFTFGFTAGSILALLNFLWLKSSVTGLTESISDPSQQATGRTGLILRFLMRFALIAATAGYATMNGSIVSVYGVLAGLSLGVAALFCESTYEVVYLMRAAKDIERDH